MKTQKNSNVRSIKPDFKCQLIEMIAELELAVNGIEPPLPLRERTILQSRFNFEAKDYLSLSVLGKKFAISRERVRQIQDEMGTKHLTIKIQFLLDQNQFRKTIKNISKSDIAKLFATLEISFPLKVLLLTNILRLNDAEQLSRYNAKKMSKIILKGLAITIV